MNIIKGHDWETKSNWFIDRVALPIIYDSCEEYSLVFKGDGVDHRCVWDADAMGVLVELHSDVPHYKHEFRLLDDDGEIYAYGWSEDDSSFAPLDWAVDNWGCTAIEYYDEGAWVML